MAPGIEIVNQDEAKDDAAASVVVSAPVVIVAPGVVAAPDDAEARIAAGDGDLAALERVNGVVATSVHTKKIVIIQNTFRNQMLR